MSTHIHRPIGQLILCFAIALLGVAEVSAGGTGTTQGQLEVNGKPLAFPYAYVFHEEHPFNAGEQATVIKLTTEEVAKRDLASPFAGGSTLTVRFGSDGQVYGRDLFLRTAEGTQSVSGLNFEFSLDQSGPDVYQGSIGGSVDHFDDRYKFSIQFAAAPLADSGTPLPVGGGKPGDAYRAYFDAITSGDMERIRKVMLPEKVAAMRDSGMSEDELLEFFTLVTPSKIEVVGGFLEGNLAYLDVTMVMEGQPGTGTITMEKVDGRWYSANEAWKQ